MRINSLKGVEPSFGKLIWKNNDKDATQFALAELMRFNKNGHDKVKFSDLEDQFSQIDNFDEDVYVSCTAQGNDEDCFFSVCAHNASNALLADTLVTLAGNFDKDSKTQISGFADLVRTSLDKINGARKLSSEQVEFQKQAKEYMNRFDKTI